MSLQSQETSPAPSPALWCYRSLSVPPAVCTSSPKTHTEEKQEDEQNKARRKVASEIREATHVCRAIACVVPDVVHHRGQVLQAVGDVVWQ